MDTDLLRHNDGCKGRLNAGEFRSPPARQVRVANSVRYTRTPRRQLGEASPGCRPTPVVTNVDGRVTQGRSRRRSYIHESVGKMVVKMPVKNLVMEEVIILKRGEQAAMDRRPEDPDDLALCSVKRLGPDPEILPKQTRLVERKIPLYAGSGFFSSPSPRSLPLPTTFFAHKEMANTTDLATRGLRYLLRLDLP